MCFGLFCLFELVNDITVM